MKHKKESNPFKYQESKLFLFDSERGKNHQHQEFSTLIQVNRYLLNTYNMPGISLEIVPPPHSRSQLDNKWLQHMLHLK